MQDHNYMKLLIYGRIAICVFQHFAPQIFLPISFLLMIISQLQNLVQNSNESVDFLLRRKSSRVKDTVNNDRIYSGFP